MFEFKLPQTSDDLYESVIVIWYKSEGEVVRAGEVLVEVQTEKATFELESPVTGVISKILVNRAQTAEVGDVIAWIEDQTQSDARDGGQASEVFSQESDTHDTHQLMTGAANGATDFVSMSPRLRKLAEQLGVDSHSVTGTGPQGRITEDDIRRAKSDSRILSGVQSVRKTITRRTIAEHMTQSLQQTAQLTLQSYVDVTELALQRKSLERDASWNEWVLRAVVVALRQHPLLNGHLIEDGMSDEVEIHLGIAVDTEDGLLVPVIHHADQLSLHALCQEVSRLVIGAQSRNLTAADLSGGTFTVTNLGGFGVQFFTPIINYPESGILGVGQLEEYPVRTENDQIAFRQRLPLSLTFDHCVLDGAPAARFLQTLQRLLSEPKGLL